MTTRGHDQFFPDEPGFGPESSTLLFKSNPVLARDHAFSPQSQANTPAMETTHQRELQQPLSNPSSARGFRSRQILENLVAENSRLKTEVQTIQSRQADTLDRMVTDLVKAKSELQTKDIKLSGQIEVIETQNAELDQLRRDASDMSAKLQYTQIIHSDAQKSAELRQNIGQLTTELRERDLNLREKDQILREREFELGTTKGQLEQEQKQRGKDAIRMQELQNMIKSQDHTQRTIDDSQLEIERARTHLLRQELDEMKIAHASALAQIDSGNATIQQFSDKLSRSEVTQDAAQSALNTERSKNKHLLQEMDKRTVVHKKLKSQIEAGEAKALALTRERNSLQESFQRTASEMKDKSQLREQLEATHAHELAEAHRSAKFFKKNSEATSRKVKGLEAEIQTLRQSTQKNREVQGDDTTGTRMQDDGFSEPPGAWPEVDLQRNPSSLRRKALPTSGMT